MPKLPGVNHQDAIRAFRKAGFHVARQGKHVTMTGGDRTSRSRGTIRSTPTRWPGSSSARV